MRVLSAGLALRFRRLRMPIDRSFVAPFPWGVLVVSDSADQEPIPPWRSDADVVTSTAQALVVRVQEGSEGQVEVRIEPPDAGQILVFDGTLTVPTGLVRISDALGEASIQHRVVAGAVRIRVFVDRAEEAQSVALLFG
jgi:hypothetical protein